MEQYDVKGGRNYYYKKCTYGNFDIVREYWIDTYMDGAQLFLARKKLVDGNESNVNNRRSYSINHNTSWEIFLKDLSMATFSASDSYGQDYMFDCLKIILRNKEIDKILN